MAGHPFSSSLVELTALLGEVLGGPMVPNIVLTRELCELAMRHQVASLLYGVARDNRHAAAENLIEDLQASYRASMAHRQAALAILEGIADQFSRRGLEWMVFKGTTQAEQLYRDPAWRDSSDIDLLVTPKLFARALDLLVEMGFVASYPPVPARGLLRHLVLGAVRDVMLVSPSNTSDSIELHRRLFFAAGRHAEFLTLPVSDARMPVAEIGPDLAFYLIAHGALSFWVRLKWLVDLVPVLGRLDHDGLIAIRTRAEGARAENATASSLILLQKLFPFVALGPLHGWMQEMSSRFAVQRRFRRYASAVGSDDGTIRSPLNDARLMLEASLLLFEAPSTRARILLDAPFSSAMRRLAGLLYRRERALTLA